MPAAIPTWSAQRGYRRHQAGGRGQSPGPRRPHSGDGAHCGQKAKLSFKQKHALETLPKEIETLDAEIAKLNALLADPALYARDPKAFAEASAKLTAAEAAKSKAEDEWLELEMMREQIEG